MEQVYSVKKCETKSSIEVSVPGSKSITNRALLLAALSVGECTLDGVLFSEDTFAFLDCIKRLGFSLRVNEEEKRVWIKGEGGIIPNRKAELNVQSAGTAARFLPAMLAFAGGEYKFVSSEQMARRPMEGLISALRSLGVTIECEKEEGHFPFTLKSEGVKRSTVEIDTTVSSQFASALLLSGVISGITVKTTGNRKTGAYVRLSVEMLKQFGVAVEEENGVYYVPHSIYSLSHYTVEPDLSAACYFYAAAVILRRKISVHGVTNHSLQGDKKFLSVLKQMGASVLEEENSITVCGKETFLGGTFDLNDFSDQSLTLAAIAPFASSPVKIENIGHIRSQECDRIHAIKENLTALNVSVEEGEDFVIIHPLIEANYPQNTVLLETFSDHRVAMSFAIFGLKTGNVALKNPDCTKKTFATFFSVLEKLYE